MSSAINVYVVYLGNVLSVFWAFMCGSCFTVLLKKDFNFVSLSQSTINPVDAVYQPSPLEPAVINTMPTQSVIPPGTV